MDILAITFLFRVRYYLEKRDSEAASSEYFDAFILIDRILEEFQEENNFEF